MGAIAQQFISNLTLKTDEIVIIDSEAGIEHFGRDVEKDVDTILMVLDPSYESVKLSEKVAELSKSINKPVFFVLNKVDASNERIMREAVKGQNKVIAVFPSVAELSLAGLRGEELAGEYAEIRKLSERLMDN